MNDQSPISEPTPSQEPQRVVHCSAVPPPSGRRSFAPTEIISWIIVLVLVSLTAISVGIEQRREAGSDEDLGNAQMAMSAKYGIGVNALFHLPGADTQLLSQLDNAAKSPADHLRVAIVAGELVGGQEASRLNALDDGKNELQGDIVAARFFYYSGTTAPESGEQRPQESDVASNGDDMPGNEAVKQTVMRRSEQDFHKKWGFFADVAEAYGKGPSDPARAKMLAACYRTVAAILAIVIFGGGAALIGLVLLIIGLVLFAQGKLKLAYGATSATVPALPDDRRAYIEGFAIYLAMLLGAGFVLRRLLHLPEMIVAGIGLSLMPISVALALLWPRIRGGTWAEWRAAFGLHTGRGFVREVFAGFIGYLAGLPLMLAGLVVMLVLVQIAHVRPSHPITSALEQGGFLIIFLAFIAASVWAPITEELLFRGALFSHLRERFSPIISAITVGLIFALVHPQGWPLVPVLGTIGFNFAMIRQWRGSIIPCITAHSIHNTLTLIFALSVLR